MIPLNGTITSAMVRAELGITGPVASLANHPGFRRATGIPSGTVKLSDLRGAHVQKTNITAASNTQNLWSLMGQPPLASSRYRFVIEPGVVVGSSYPTSNAMAYGQFPAGSTITIDLYGTLGGAGGRYGVAASASGQGGAALFGAGYASQTMYCNVKPGGFLAGGGGSGGPGGNGGAGSYGGSFQTVIGGAGGLGGAGGMWGKGQGTDGIVQMGGPGSPGSPGQPGTYVGAFGDKSGDGGAGGRGGDGGGGGSWGVDGNPGAGGQGGYAGQPSTSGGQPGVPTPGQVGGNSGPKGYALYSGGAVVLNNSGTVLGLVS